MMSSTLTLAELEGRTLADLKAMAETLGVNVPAKATKADVVADVWGAYQAAQRENTTTTEQEAELEDRPDQDGPPAPAETYQPEDASGRFVQALARAQAEFPVIPKTETAEVRDKVDRSRVLYTYTYADLGGVLSAVRPVLARHGLAIIQTTTRGDQGQVILETELLHVAGGSKRSTVDLGRDTRDPQAFGGALTYLRRYQAVTILGIAAEQDQDAAEVPVPDRGGRQSAPPPTPEPPAWARPVPDSHKAALLANVALVIGDAPARRLLKNAAKNYGAVPLILSTFTEELARSFMEAHPALAEEELERRKAAAAARVDQERQAQSGEQPDAPSPEPVPEVHPEPEVDPEPEPPAIREHPRRNAAEDVLRDQGCVCPDPEGLEDEQGRPTFDDDCRIPGHGIAF